MHYQITAPLTAAAEKQADELGRLLTHAGSLMLQFVTVAGRYKPIRARLTLLRVPDRLSEPALRVLALLSSYEGAAQPSAALRIRPEWTERALLLPIAPDAPPLDGALLDGWDSACLSLTYRPGRVLGWLRHCPEDRARVAALRCDGWQIIARPNPLQRAAGTPGRRWQGVPSFAPVPGGVATPNAVSPAATERSIPAPIDAPAPIAEELRAALTEGADGLLLGVTPQGDAVRLARRALTLSVSGPAEARQRAVLALLRHGMQAGLGIVALIDRALLPREALAVWEARVRLLDVQQIAESSAIAWRQIAPDLLAQAIGGPAAALPTLPSRFGAVLDALGATALRVPALLGLATTPGDDLRGVLAAGGLIVVPQDGDAASTLVARLLLAYLATPPALGRGVLLLAEPALLPPEALAQQAIQVVLGERSDALLRLAATENGWTLRGPDGASLAELLPDLLTQPNEGAGELADTIIHAIDTEQSGEPLPAAPPDMEANWWASGARDAVEPIDEQPITGVLLPLIDEMAAGARADELPIRVAAALPVVVEQEPIDEQPISGVLLPLIAGMELGTTIEELPLAAVLTRAPADERPIGAATAQPTAVEQELISGSRTPLIDGMAAGARADERPIGAATAQPTAVEQELISGVLLAPIAGMEVDMTVEELPPAAVLAGAAAVWPTVVEQELISGVLLPLIAATAGSTPADALDAALGCLLDALMAAAPTHASDAAIQTAVADEDFARADAVALAWSSDAPQLARPWLWRVVLAEHDIDRAVAVWRAIQSDPDDAHVPLLRAVLGALDAAEPAAWLAHLGDDPLAELFERVPPSADTEPLKETVAEHDSAPALSAPAALDWLTWPVALADAPALCELGRDEGAPSAVAPRSVTAGDALSDDAIRVAWQGGESVPQLVTRLIASGLDLPAARTRVRSIVTVRSATMAADRAGAPAPGISGVTMPFMNVLPPLVPTEVATSLSRPAVSVTALVPASVASVELHPTPSPAAMNGNPMPPMADGALDDAAIWQRWLANEKTEELVFALSGRRGGPRADAARDRIYGVVVPHIVAALDCYDLVARLAAGAAVADDPRYGELLRQIARSAEPPSGNLERACRTRLLGMWPAVAP